MQYGGGGCLIISGAADDVFVKTSLRSCLFVPLACLFSCWVLDAWKAAWRLGRLDRLKGSPYPPTGCLSFSVYIGAICVFRERPLLRSQLSGLDDFLDEQRSPSLFVYCLLSSPFGLRIHFSGQRMTQPLEFCIKYNEPLLTGRDALFLFS